MVTVYWKPLIEVTADQTLMDSKNSDFPYLVTFEDGAEFGITRDQLDDASSRLEHMKGDVYLFSRDGRSTPVVICRDSPKSITIWSGNLSRRARIADHRDQLLSAWGFESDASSQSDHLSAPMPGLVLAILVEPGQHIEANQPLLVLEAMKMENELKAEASGVIDSVQVTKGQAVAKGDILIRFRKGDS